MKRILNIIILLSAVAASSSTIADGLPTPWPFPWAKNCPMSWEELSGEYRMEGSESRDRIVVRVTGNSKGDLKTVRVFRMSAKGTVRAIGLALVDQGENEVKVHMIPLRKKYGEKWIFLRMYFTSFVSSCNMNELVPIMSVSDTEDLVPNTKVDYLLIKVQEQADR